MTRKRTDLGPGVDARIATLIRRGGTAESITAALGGTVSSRTIGRRMKEIRGPVASPRAQRVGAPTRPVAGRSTGVAGLGATDARRAVEAIPEDVPDGTPLGQLDSWIALASVAIDRVKPGGVDENLPLFGQLLSRASALSETRRKATPPERVDLNDHPDMIAMGRTVKERLHKMIDMVVEEGIS